MSESRTDKQTEASTGDEKLVVSKRRLLNAGLASAPLYLTLKSTPVLATTNCKNPSGFSVSGQASRPNDFLGCTAFKRPNGWASDVTSGWGALDDQRTRKIRQTLGDVPSRYALIDRNTQLQTAITSSDALVRYLVAAYLNSKAGGGFPVTTAQVQAMWSGGGSYEPATGFSAWNDTDLLAYLQYLMTP